MTDYSLVAFYQKEPSEVKATALAVSRIFRLSMRLLPLPYRVKEMQTVLTENTVLGVICMKEHQLLKCLKYVYALPCPVLIVPEKVDCTDCADLKIPVGYERETRECAVWANFLYHRNPGLNLELIVPKEWDSGIAAQVDDNLSFMKNIFIKSQIPYRETFMPYSFEKSLGLIGQKAQKEIILMMRPFRLFSYYIPNLFRLIFRGDRAAVLVIPRDESLYLPCH